VTRIATRAAPLLAAVAVLIVVSGCATASPSTASSSPHEQWAASGLIEPHAQLVLQATRGSGDAIYTQQADGSGRDVLVDLDDSSFHPDWSPDGTRLAWRESTPEKDQIWTAASDGSDPAVLVTCDDACFGSDFPAWSPDGTSLVYTSYLSPLADDLPPSGSTLRVIEVATGMETVVASSDVGDILDNARWSPNGDRLVFQIDRFDSEGTEVAMMIATVPSSGGQITPLTDPAMFAGYPDWSPDGERIVFCTYDLGAFDELPQLAASNLYTVSPDGSDLRALTDLPPNGKRVTQPSWTANGAGILATVVAVSGTRSIAVVPVDGGQPIALPDSNGTHARESRGSRPD
jgi:Tol biopolymer transport system component